MKKLISILLATLMLVTVIAGCGGNTETSSNASTADVSTEAPVETPEQAKEKLDKIVADVKAAYGENYLPSMPLDETMFAEQFSVNMENVEYFVAEVPMISFHVDKFFAVKAVAGKGDAVYADLNAYATLCKEQLMNYPANEAKINATQVIQHGDYVFFVMLGAMDDRMDITEEEAKTFAEAEIKKGVDVINGYFA